MPQPTEYEPWMGDVVAQVYGMTSPPMLTLRCPETAHLIKDPKRRESCQKARALGSEAPATVRKKGEDRELRNTLIRRRVEVRFKTPVFPQGVPIGVNETGKYVTSQSSGGQEFVVLSSNYDISLPQMDVLHAISRGEKYPTATDYAESQRLMGASQVQARKQQMDPQGQKVRDAEIMASALTKAGFGGAKPAPAEMTDEEFEKEAVRRRMAKARAAKGQKAPEESVAG